jgi:hypothetical protein
MLAPILADRILDDGEALEFDLDGCWVDAVELIRLSRESAGDPELRTSPLRTEVGAVLDVARGPFLEFWEELEARASEADSESVTQVVIDEVRGRLERCRVDLLLAMAKHSLWRNEALEAIPFLEEALALRPDRDDVAESLIAAYERSGRESEARALRESR